MKALENGPLDPDGVREATGKPSRSLGEEGKKKGLTTTLPLALGRVQTEGKIRRIPINGRLDQQRYKYVNWAPSPLANHPESLDAAFTELARHYYGWAGQATLGEFQEFAGLGVKATKQAVEPLGLVPAEPGSDRLLSPDDAAAFRAYEPPSTSQYNLISGLDPINANRREIQTMIDDKDRAKSVMVDMKLGKLGELVDLPSHAILDRGQIVGLWEFDVESSSIVWATFSGKKDKPQFPRPASLFPLPYCLDFAANSDSAIIAIARRSMISSSSASRASFSRRRLQKRRSARSSSNVTASSTRRSRSR